MRENIKSDFSDRWQQIDVQQLLQLCVINNKPQQTAWCEDFRAPHMQVQTALWDTEFQVPFGLYCRQ